MANLTDMTAARIREGLASQEFSAREVAQAHLDHMDAAEPKIHAFLERTDALALDAADRIDAVIAAGTFADLGPLAGVPVAFKDNMNQKGTHTTCASRMLENYVAPYTATCVQRMLDAGCLPLGKLNMDEFAFGSSTENSAFGVTRNPWDLDRVPGGSSGGSAAGHGSRHVRLRHGRLNPPAGRLLRRRGREAHLRHGVALRRGSLRQLA